MPYRVTGRATFGALARARRLRRGCVSVAVVPPGDDTGSGVPAQVAYAIGRRVGGAVVRNRVRRRLRAAVQAHEDLLAPGAAYLVSAGPEAATLPYHELDGHLVAALEAVARRGPGGPR